MNKILDKTRQFIFAKQTSMFSSAMIISLMIVISSLCGFLRFRILSGIFTKDELDIFLASFRIPDLIFEILITGALTSSFIPIFIKFQEKKEELDINISSIINLIMLIMFSLIILLFIFMDRIVPLITPGFPESKIIPIILYSRMLLLGQLPLMIMANFLTGIGQAEKKFLLSAVAPVLYNLSIIVSSLVLSSYLFLLAPIIGVILGAVLFFLIQLPLLHDSKFKYFFVIKKTQGLVEFFRVIIPRGLTVIVSQLDATVDLILATFLGSGSYTVFYFAQRLQLLPVSVIGVAFGQASLPYLSEVYQAKKFEEFKKIIIDSILNLIFFVIPIMSFFIFARTPLIRLFFGGQKFDWEATVSTAVTLSYFAFSLPFHSLYYFLTRCFYAFLDTKTPFFISVASILINTLLSIVFVLFLKLPVWSLAISFSFSMIVNVLILIIILSKKIQGLDFGLLLFESMKMIAATGISSFIVYYLMKLMDGLVFDTSFTINVFLLLLTGAIIYFSLYLFICWLIDVKEIYLVTKLILKAKEYHKRIIEFYTSYE